jgi:hypothetical protein
MPTGNAQKTNDGNANGDQVRSTLIQTVKHDHNFYTFKNETIVSNRYLGSVSNKQI